MRTLTLPGENSGHLRTVVVREGIQERPAPFPGNGRPDVEVPLARGGHVLHVEAAEVRGLRLRAGVPVRLWRPCMPTDPDNNPGLTLGLIERGPDKGQAPPGDQLRSWATANAPSLWRALGIDSRMGRGLV